MTFKPTASAVLVATALIAGCGETTTSAPPSAKSAKAEIHDAYYPGLMPRVERSIKRKFMSRGLSGGHITDMDVDCNPDNERTFSCQGTIDVKLEGGGCGTYETEHHGQVIEGDFTWNTHVTDQSMDAYC